MKGFQKSSLKGDMLGGLTAGIVALPLSLAFGIQAFGVISVEDVPNIGALSALAGITGAMILGFMASLFGGTHSQISGPTGPMTVIAATFISMIWATAAPHSIGTVMVAIAMAGILCGIFQIIFGLIKIGKYVRYIPYPVLSGFMSGVGVIIILQQLFPLIGMKSPVLIIDMLTQFPSKVGGADIKALVLGLGTIAVIYLFPKVTKKVPSSLVALLTMTIVALFIDYPSKLTIGEIPSSIPLPIFANKLYWIEGIDWLAVAKMSVIPALTLAGLGSIDTLLTSVVADNITRTKHNSNRELMGQGIGNIFVGLFAGLPGCGAAMRTVVNIKNGGRNRLSGMTHGLFLFAVLLGLGRYVSYIPLSVLSGILITVGISIIDFKGLKDITKIPRADAAVLLSVLVLTVFVDLLTAVGIGMVIASVLFMKRVSDLTEKNYEGSELMHYDKESPWNDEETLTEDLKRKIYVQRLNGPIFFGSITRFREVMQEIPKGIEVVIIRMKLVTFMDQSGLYAMETAIKELQEKGIRVLMTIIQPQPKYMLETMDVIPDIIPVEDTFSTFGECMEALKNMREKGEI
jgi:SulP family sulfate permease